MEKPTTPAGPNASPRPEDSGSEQDFGATGVFGTMKTPEPAERPAASWGKETESQGNRATEVAKPQPVPAPKPLAEPVVHRVVFGGGAAESLPELLDRMRMASAERMAAPEKAPSAEVGGESTAASPEILAGGQGSGGFTELLRTLNSDLPSTVVAAVQAHAPETQLRAQESGLTSLLQTPGPPPASAPLEDREKKIEPAVPSVPDEPRRPSVAPGTGGFTELLQTMPAGATGGITAPLESKPGTFTQLFGTLGSAEASAPAPVERGTGESTHGGAGSFTRMLSLKQQSAPDAPPFREETKLSATNLDYEHTPQTAEPARASSNPFSSSPLPEAQPGQSAPPGGGAGITRLIQMLDQPGSASAQRIEGAPVSAPPGGGPGVWTQTFASLNESAAPQAKTPEWNPPPAPSPAPSPAVARDAHFSGSQNEPAVSTSAAAGITSGPSEFTRILDASRIRELAMKGSQASQASNPPPPQSIAQPASPNYSAPVPPYSGGMPHPGGFTPPHPQMPSFPMNYGPQAGAMSAPGGSLPQQPGMYIPAPSMPAVPPAPQLKPVEPGMGKLQQYVPLLLVVTIVLLVAVLVTIIFVMKH
ncbi:MAG: hypothetical protein WAK26_20685 [Terracidiphilus sp.]